MSAAMSSRKSATSRSRYGSSKGTVPEEASRLGAFERSVQEGRYVLLNEVKQLHADAQELEKRFKSIERGISRILDGGGSPDVTEKLSHLLDNWKDIKKEYSGLFWRSREFAGTVANACNDFSSTFIPFLFRSDVPLEEKKNELDQYEKSMLEYQERSLEHSQGFKDLKERVTDFYKDWKRIVKNVTLSEIQDDITVLGEELETLNKKIKELENEIMKVATECGVFLSSGGVNTLIGSIFPTFFLESIRRIAIQTRYKSEFLGTVENLEFCLSERTSKKKMLAESQANCKGLAKLATHFENSRNDFTFICGRLGAFATVWSAIRSDIQAIREMVNLAIRGTAGAPEIRLENVSSLYQTLSDALKAYERIIDDDLNDDLMDEDDDIL
ncbi:hypothetical protein C8Q75DRAFT_803145 [Abortiporus biennis]|nr:hypothetical protein C8Q75DRAFT_803145 [Abortiporus biennis]